MSQVFVSIAGAVFHGLLRSDASVLDENQGWVGASSLAVKGWPKRLEFVKATLFSISVCLPPNKIQRHWAQL